MVSYKRKLKFISDLVCCFDLYRKDIKVNDLFLMSLKRIISLDDEKKISSVITYFSNECISRRKEVFVL